jgi:hypothetical protein
MRDHTKLRAFELADEIAVFLEDSSLFDRCEMVEILQPSAFSLQPE